MNLPFVTADQSGPKHINMKITRAQLESLVEDLVNKTIEPCKLALSDAGLETKDIDDVILVGGQTRMPRVQQVVKDFFGKEPRKDINPDEAVAMGAAIQGGVLSGEVTNKLLLDVTPLSLGIETLGGVMTKLIERNTTIPTNACEVFSTADDNQKTVQVHVVQGEREQAKANKSLGQFNLTGIRLAPRGVPQIELTLDIDADGILNVSAKDKDTGMQQSIVIKASSGLAEAEIERMVKDAQAPSDEDRKFQEVVEARNEADALMHSTRTSVESLKEKLESSDVETIDKLIAELKNARDGNDVALIQAKSQALSEETSKIFAARTQTASTAEPPTDEGNEEPPPPGPDSSGGEDDQIMDAEVEDVT